MCSFIKDCRFISYLPSVIATGVMLHVIDGIEPCIRVQYQSQLLGILGIDKVGDVLTSHYAKSKS